LPRGDDPGLAPNVRWYESQGGFRRSMSASQSTGHGALRVTPIQLARAYAMLATGAAVQPWYVKPADVAERYRFESAERSSPFPPVALPAGWEAALPRVREALRRAVASEGGTAHFVDLTVDAAGKTGSADDGDTRLGWFAGWDPASEPRRVVVFLAEGRDGREVARMALTFLGTGG
jgi:penicillin-binding protein 2